jgi:hypothetical protein
MSRYRSTGQLDEAAVVDGDTGFLGVDERDPSQVPPGFCSMAENKYFRNKVAEDRLGVEALPWLNDSTSHTYITPLTGGPLGGAVFNDPDDVEWILVATPTKVYAVREGSTPIEVPLPSPSVTLTEVSFVQTMDRMIMFRGTSLPELEMLNVATGFTNISQQANTEAGNGTNNPTDGTDTIPQASSGLWMGNRLYIPHSRDLVAASDYLNYTRYSPTRADFRINQGSADQLVGLYKFGDAGLIAFKEQTIHIVSNVHGDLSLIRQEVLTTEFGLVARKAVASDGADPWFLSQRGVTSIGQILDNKARTQKTTWSDPMIETMKRVNWMYAGRATATYFDGNFYLALPLDDAQVTNNAGTFTGVNNAILIFDNQNQAWAGIWSGSSVMVKDWLQFTWNGKRRLGYLSDDGMIMMLNHGFDDWVRADGGGNTRAEIASKFRTRGYTFAPNDSSPEERRAINSTLKRYRRATCVLNTWNPKYTIKALADGVNETTTVVLNETRDRTKWVRPFDRAPWNPSNVNGDHGDPGREDYSVDMDDANGGTAIDLDASGGVNLEQFQEAPLTRRLNLQGRYCQIEIDGSQGRTEIKAVEVEGRMGTRRNGLMV